MENKKIKIYGVVLGIILFILLISGLTYAILSWRSSNITIAGNSECLEVDSVKGSNITGSDLLLLDKSQVVNSNQITIRTGMVVTNITAKLKSSCTIDGYLTINLKTTTLNSGFTSSGKSTGALKYVLASYNPSTYTTISTSALNGKTFDIVTTGSITSTGTLKIKEAQLSKDTTLAYLVIFYIDGEKANNDIGSNSTNFKTSIEATVTQGTAPMSAASLISNLYNNASKTPVTNNSITYQYDTKNSLMKDTAGNIRYYGASPNNYIYFNCSDYSNQSSSTCETWRIIGVFDGKVKLIRNESIGAYSWDNKEIDSTWETASLMKLLNPGYESETVGGSLYYNSGSGNCYSGQSKATTACNFTSSGLKNDITKNVIAKQDWNIGPTDQKYVNVEYENEVKNTFKAYIGLPNVSDYGYATNLNLCSAELVNYSNSECKNNNWMFYMATGSKKLAYFINYASNSGLGVLAINALTEGGNVEIFDNDINDTIPTTSSDIFPTVYLSNLVSITDGTGTSSNPYQLQVN